MRHHRELLGLSRERLAAKAETSTSTISRLEIEERVPSVRILLALAAALDVTLDQLTESLRTASA